MAMSDLDIRREMAAEVKAFKATGRKFDEALLPGGAYRNAGGIGWHDSEGRAIAPPPGYDEAGNAVKPEPIAEPAAEAPAAEPAVAEAAPEPEAKPKARR